MASNRVTVKSTIVDAILEGWRTDRILKAVNDQFPLSKINESHVKHCANTLKREGEITWEHHTKYVRATVKSTVVNAILEGWRTDRILKAVKKQFPLSKIEESHVKQYSSILKREGEITEEHHAKYLERPRLAVRESIANAKLKAKADKRTAKALEKTASVNAKRVKLKAKKKLKKVRS